MNSAQASPATATAPLLSHDKPSLSHLLSPRHVAVIGASEEVGSVGRTVLANLLASPFGGTVYPVNAQMPSVLGTRSFIKVSAIPERVDLAAITTSAPTVPGIVAECVSAGVKSVVIFSSGFAELGPAGAELARHALDIARQGNVRLIGPNSSGVMSPLSGLNATYAGTIAKPGGIAFLSQSGAMCTAIVDWSRRENLGFSGIVSLGEMIDIGWSDLIDHFGADSHTRAILIYMEDIGNARAFLSAARAVAMVKPIILLKGGRTAASARACVAHNAAATESDEVFDALLARAGVLRVNSIAELFGAADLLGNQPLPAGKHLGIVTNAGGPGVLALDNLSLCGGGMATLTSRTLAALDAALPNSWSHGNPIDVLGDAGPEQFAIATRLALADPTCDGVLVVLSSQGMTDSTRTAELVASEAQGSRKPLFASWMGGPSVEAGRILLGKAGIPTFDFPDTAARAWCTLCSYSERLRLLYETPHLEPDGMPDAPDRATARLIIDDALADGRTTLNEMEAKQLLKSYRLHADGVTVAEDDYEAARHAERLGFPVILKTYPHVDPGKKGGPNATISLGVDSELGLRTAFHAIRNFTLAARGSDHFHGVTVHPQSPHNACELSFSMRVDAQVGPVVTVGTGGRLAALYHDYAVGLPPLTSILARRMLDQIAMVRAYNEAGTGKSLDLRTLEQALVRFSHLVADQPRIKSLVIDPLIAVGDSLTAIGISVVLHDPTIPIPNLPKPAVRPYPSQYSSRATLADGTAIAMRPVRPEDEPGFVMLHKQLSAQTVRFRWFADMPLDQRIAHARLARVCHSDYDRELALVAEVNIPGIGDELIGVGRLSRKPGVNEEAELALLVADPWQHRGAGQLLIDAVISMAKREGIRRLVATFLPENHTLRKMIAERGFTIRDNLGPDEMRAELLLP